VLDVPFPIKLIGRTDQPRRISRRPFTVAGHPLFGAPEIYKRQLATALTHDVKMLIARDKGHGAGLLNAG
jgi:hypothetical protein